MTNLFYYIDRDGNIKGPVTQSEFVNLGITPDTKVWHKGMSDWRTLAEVLSDSQQSQSPTPPDSRPTTTPPPLPSGSTQSQTQASTEVSSNGNLSWIVGAIIFFITLLTIVLGIGRGCNRNNAETYCDSDSCVTTSTYDYYDYPVEAPAETPAPDSEPTYDYDYALPVADSCK